MPPSLSVPLKHEFALSVILEDAATVLQSILNTPSMPTFAVELPPGAANKSIQPAKQFLGLGFSGVYLTNQSDDESLVEVGAITVHRTGEPARAYFSGGRTAPRKL